VIDNEDIYLVNQEFSIIELLNVRQRVSINYL
jgi:hypothetical protein